MKSLSKISEAGKQKLGSVKMIASVCLTQGMSREEEQAVVRHKGSEQDSSGQRLNKGVSYL